jgi:antitoxin FitA
MSQRAAFKITLPAQHASKLGNLAREAGVSPEEFLGAKVENWLAHPETDFAEAAAYVVKKNADLYRRLA